MPNIKLDKEIIRGLLQKADDRWFATHSGQFNYQEHLEFTAEYVARNYHKETQKRQRRSYA